MRTTVLSLHPGLAGSSRLPVSAGQSQSLRAAELVWLLGAGVAAALATAFLDPRLGIPGSAIIRAVFPMAFGLALAPRRMAGLVMGMGAVSSALVIKGGGFASIGAGAMTSLTLTGPLLDLALWRARRGWGLYLAFAVAGVGSNLVALAVRAGFKAGGGDRTLARPLAAWWPQAIGTYVLCGALAGLISALVWFRLTAKSSRGADKGTAE